MMISLVSNEEYIYSHYTCCSFLANQTTNLGWKDFSADCAAVAFPLSSLCIWHSLISFGGGDKLFLVDKRSAATVPHATPSATHNDARCHAPAVGPHFCGGCSSQAAPCDI